MKFKTFPFTGIFQKAMAQPEQSGAWIIWGAEKNGKTWFALKLADYISRFTRVLYVSAEEGVGLGFVEACKRAGLEAGNRSLMFNEYMDVSDISSMLKKRKSPKVVFLDNCTIYADAFKSSAFRDFLKLHPEKLFVFIAHEEKGQPYTAAAKLAKKLAKITIHVQGLAAHIGGRCPGGTISIDEEKAALYWGDQINDK